MRFIFRFMGLLLLVFTSALAALPQVPANGIRDDARSLSAPAAQRLADEMKAFTQRTGWQIFLDTNTFIDSGANVRARAKELLAWWGNGKPGVVMCVDRTSKEGPGIQLSDELWERSTEGDMLTLLDSVVMLIEPGKLNEASVLAAMRSLMTKLEEMQQLSKERERILRPTDLWLVGTFLALLAAGTIVARLIIRWNGRRENTEATQHWFPDVEVSQRLGAPYGGGVIEELAFRPKAE